MSNKNLTEEVARLQSQVTIHTFSSDSQFF
jgi:hypothetical protein